MRTVFPDDNGPCRRHGGVLGGRGYARSGGAARKGRSDARSDDADNADDADDADDADRCRTGSSDGAPERLSDSGGGW